MGEADRLRGEHVTRRVLYVARTRARDRLYLSSALKEGEMVPGRGSLGEVFPSSLKALFKQAGIALPATSVVSWPAASGRTFEWQVREAPIPPVETS